MTDDSAFKRQVRARMAETGEKYTEARRIVIEDAASIIHDSRREDSSRNVLALENVGWRCFRVPTWELK